MEKMASELEVQRIHAPQSRLQTHTYTHLFIYLFFKIKQPYYKHGDSIIKQDPKRLFD